MAEIDWHRIEQLLIDSARSQGCIVDTNDRSEPGVWVDDSEFLSFEKLAREVAERIGK